VLHAASQRPQQQVSSGRFTDQYVPARIESDSRSDYWSMNPHPMALSLVLDRIVSRRAGETEANA